MRLYLTSFEQKTLFRPSQLYKLSLSAKYTTEKVITKKKYFQTLNCKKYRKVKIYN